MTEILKTKSGLDKLELMKKFIFIIEPAEPDESEWSSFKIIDDNFTKLISWLTDNLGRKLTNMEKLKLSQGIMSFLLAQAGSEDRMEAMTFLFEANFLDS